jgi:hypothetical protein
MTNFWDALDQVDQTQPEFIPEYRLYYDENTGVPLFYSMEQPEGKFIWIDRDTYARCRFDIRVKKGKIVSLKPGIGKLVPAEEGIETAKSDISIVEAGSNTHWKTKTYELD